MAIKNKKNKLLYASSVISMALTTAISVLSYNNDTPSLDISLQLNNSTVSNGTINNVDMIKSFIYDNFSPKEINLAICCIIMALNFLNAVVAYLNTKKIDEKDKSILDMSEEIALLTNQAQSVQLNVPENINVEANYVPSRIHSYNLSNDIPPFNNLNNEPITFELDSNAIMESTRTSVYPSPVEIKH